MAQKSVNNKILRNAVKGLLYLKSVMSNLGYGWLTRYMY